MPNVEISPEARSNAARKAWATRRANGWTHPGSTKAPAKAAEPIKTGALAAIAKGGKPLRDVLIEGAIAAKIAKPVTAAKVAKELAAKPAKPARKKVRTTAKPRKAKKAAPKKTASARARR